MPDQKEAEVLLDCKQILDALKMMRVLDYWRINTGAKLLKGGILAKNNDTIGFSDLLILLPKNTLFVELKATKGLQYTEQKEFQKRIEAMGHKYFLCHSREELCDILKEMGVLLNHYISG